MIGMCVMIAGISFELLLAVSGREGNLPFNLVV